MVFFVIIALITFAASNFYDLKLTEEGLKAGVAVEKSGLTLKQLLLRDGLIYAGVVASSMTALYFHNNPLAFLMGVASTVGAIKHAIGAYKWSKFLKG